MKFRASNLTCSKWLYSSIDIVDKGRPCLVINRNNTWFLVMCELHFTCIHVKYNYPLHKLERRIIIFMMSHNAHYKNCKNIFYRGSVLVCGFDEIHCQRGRNFPHIYTPHCLGGEIFHTTFLHNFLFVFWVCVFCTHSFGSFLDSIIFHFFFSKPWKSES